MFSHFYSKILFINKHNYAKQIKQSSEHEFLEFAYWLFKYVINVLVRLFNFELCLGATEIITVSLFFNLPHDVIFYLVRPLSAVPGYYCLVVLKL